MDKIQGFILAGGASRRMGEPKFALNIGGRTFVEKAAGASRARTAGHVTVVGDIADRYLNVRSTAAEDHSLRKIPDTIIERDFSENKAPSGALIGLYTALTEAESEWIAVLACDLPFVTGDLMTRLAGDCSDEFDAVVPVQPDGQSQPLCAFYRCEESMPVVQQLIADGDLKMQGFVSRLSTRFVEFEEIADLDGSANFFLNVNRPEDYETALRIATS